jgi:hypothetical protein
MEKFLDTMRWGNIARVARCRFTDWRSSLTAISTDLAKVASRSPLSLISAMLVDDFVENPTAKLQQNMSFNTSDKIEKRKKAAARKDLKESGADEKMIEAQAKLNAFEKGEVHHDHQVEKQNGGGLSVHDMLHAEAGEDGNENDDDDNDEDDDDDDDDDETSLPKYQINTSKIGDDGLAILPPTSPGTPGNQSGRSSPLRPPMPTPPIAQRDILFHKLAPRLDGEQLLMLMVSLVADSARSIIVSTHACYWM